MSTKNDVLAVQQKMHYSTFPPPVWINCKRHQRSLLRKQLSPVLRFCLPPGKNITYCLVMIFCLTPSIHIYVRRPLQLCGGRLVLFLYCACFPLTGQISDCLGHLSSIRHTNALHPGEEKSVLNWVNCDIFLLRNVLHGKHEYAFTLFLVCYDSGAQRGRWQKQSRMCPSRILSTQPPTVPQWPLYL